MLLTDVRRAGRIESQNEVIPRDKEDRSLWDRTQIAEGVELISAALKHGMVGPYQLQAAIAAVTIRLRLPAELDATAGCEMTTACQQHVDTCWRWRRN